MTNRLVEQQQITITQNNSTNNKSSIDNPQVSKYRNKVMAKTIEKRQMIKKTAQQMKNIWDKIFSYSSNSFKLHLNKRIIKELEKINEKEFNNNLREWSNI